jgi:hypothetical protein
MRGFTNLIWTAFWTWGTLLCMPRIPQCQYIFLTRMKTKFLRNGRLSCASIGFRRDNRLGSLGLAEEVVDPANFVIEHRLAALGLALLGFEKVLVVKIIFYNLADVSY